MKENIKMEDFFENIKSFAHHELFRETSYPWEALSKLKDYTSKHIERSGARNEGHLIGSGHYTGGFIIGEGTKLSPLVVIEGPVLIGKNCVIQPGAYIRPYSIIGDNVTVGHGCEIKNSIIMNHAKVQSNTFVGDSIIGMGARVGSGTIIANRRFDQKEIGVKVNDVFYSTGSDYFGCILGDYARLGANVTTLPGTLVGAYTWVMPSVRISGYIPKETIVDEKKELTFKTNKRNHLKD